MEEAVFLCLKFAIRTSIGEVMAIDRQGRLKAGWPYRVPFDANAVIVVLRVSPDGRLLIRGGEQLLALDPDGRISD